MDPVFLAETLSLLAPAQCPFQSYLQFLQARQSLPPRLPRMPSPEKGDQNRLPLLFVAWCFNLDYGAGERTDSLKLAFYDINERKLTGLVDWNFEQIR
jgi:hypothetical protein